MVRQIQHLLMKLYRKWNTIYKKRSETDKPKITPFCNLPSLVWKDKRERGHQPNCNMEVKDTHAKHHLKRPNKLRDTNREIDSKRKESLERRSCHYRRIEPNKAERPWLGNVRRL